MTATYPILAALAAYLLGSLSFAVIVTRVMGLSDPRTYGSKNPGATNVLRSGSKAAAIITLLLDAVKGWLPVALVMWYGEPYGLDPRVKRWIERGYEAGESGAFNLPFLLKKNKAPPRTAD